MQRALFTSRLSSLRSPVLLPSFRSFSSTTPSSSIPSPSTSSTAAEQSTAFASATATSSASTTGEGAGEVESKYFVPRSQFGELPVYSDVRNGGTRVLTIIRKVHGDVSELHKDLSEFLQSSATSFVKPQSQQVVVKGDWVREVKEWLAHRGF
ncbi:hypothetical protein JCM5350_000747 [Sporobolomyces pararoseus]